MVDIDIDPFGLPGDEPPRGGDPLNEPGAVAVIRELLDFEDGWDGNDVLREGDFTKLLSFLTREGVAFQLYLQHQRFVLGRLDDHNFQWLVLPPWTIAHPAWTVRSLVAYGLSTWGV